MQLKDVINESLESLKTFQTQTEQSINKLQISVPETTPTLTNEPSPSASDVKVPLLVAGAGIVVGLSSSNGFLSTLGYLTGVAGLAYSAYLYSSSKNNAQTPSISQSPWEGKGSEILKQLGSVIVFRDDFRTLLTQNRDKIQEAIKKENFENKLRNQIEDLSFFRAVPMISESDYQLEIYNAIETQKSNELRDVITKFQSDCKKVLAKSIQEQTEKYQEMLRLI